MLDRPFVLTDCREQPESVPARSLNRGGGMDVLSDVLSAVRLTGAVFFDVDASAPWCGVSPGVERIARRVMPDAERVVAFHAILSGSCWVSLEDASTVPFLANAGDVLVVPGGAAHVMA